MSLSALEKMNKWSFPVERKVSVQDELGRVDEMKKGSLSEEWNKGDELGSNKENESNGRCLKNERRVMFQDELWRVEENDQMVLAPRMTERGIEMQMSLRALMKMNK